MKYILSLLLFTHTFAFANYIDENVKKLSWNGVEVIFLEDNSSPLFDISLYFSEGASHDSLDRLGQTNMAFNLLTSGTHKYSQKQIADLLDYYAISYSPQITHEYVTYNLTGLTQNALPAMDLMCHLFNNTTYPENEISKAKNIAITGLKNLNTQHSELANRVFREISLRGTAFDNPVDGKISTISKINSSILKETLKYFNSIKKRVYIKGPSSILEIKDTIMEKCGWQGIDSQKNYVKARKGLNPNIGNIFLLPVPNANQAQIRVGSYIPNDLTRYKIDTQDFTKKYLGGGFTSQLMQELRVKRGLTYSASAFLGSQRGYGRSGIMTFTKNETLVETLKTIQNVIKDSSTKIDISALERSKRFAAGNHLLSLESTSAFLSNLIYFDHIERPYREIYDYQKTVSSIKDSDVKSMISKMFKWDEQVILVVGDKSLEKSLKEKGYKVQIIDIKKYL